jgi:Coenzyme PQQ synthesis protein D (PqqD)
MYFNLPGSGSCGLGTPHWLTYDGGNLKDKISRQSTVVAAKGQVSCDLVDEAVILDLHSAIYYGLNPVGARVWSLIQKPKAVGALLDTLLDEYDVETERCETDLLALLEDLKSRELIVVDPETNGPVK